MKQLLKQALMGLGLLGPAKRAAWFATRGIGRNSTLTQQYLARGDAKKLHIGCGLNMLPGWMNSDFYPPSRDALHFDATKPFPLPDDTFDYVFSEHMIEHIPYRDGLTMLKESHRVLKRGGRIRISTPNFAFLVGLYAGQADPRRDAYIKWSTANFVNWAPYPDDIFVINNFVRDWEHRFIYDEKSLRHALESAGFTNVVKCELQTSASPALCGLENESRMPEGFLRLETLTLEGTKAP